MVQVVGILGFKGSGKDTAGDYLVREHGYELDSFANPLKDAVCAVFGWERQMLEGATAESREWRELPDEWWEKRLDWQSHPARHLSDRFTPRVAMQFFGTEVFRDHFHNDLWILSLENRLRHKDKVVITDCRFPNEFKVIKDLNGLAFRVKRGPEPRWYGTAVLAALGGDHQSRLMMKEGIHISEWAWLTEEFDAILENDGSILDLEEKVEGLLATHFLKS